MSQENVDTLEHEDVNQNTNTEELNSHDDSNIDNELNDSGSDDSPSDKQEEVNDSDNRVTKEQLDAMDDDEFTAYLNSGKVPDTKPVEQPKVDDKKVETKEQPVEDKTSKKEPSKKSETVQEPSQEDLKTVYNTIFKPFKANGKEITPKTLDDVISLMQMGANYTKKMQVMAPMKKAVESLNKAGIGESELNFLIDINNGDKEAIKKLLEKHKVDPIELDMENTNYVPKNNIVSDADVEYANILDDIQASLPKIQEIMTSKWDAKSKELLLKDPALLKALHEEIELGRFDDVQSRLELEKTFGRYKGKSDVEAYIDVVSKMVAEQKPANNGTKPDKPSQDNKGTTNKPIPDKSKAAPVRTKQGNQGTTLTVKDLLSMPEEEFNKLSMRDLV